MKISHLSFGASSLGSVFRETNESESFKAVETAVEGGINFIDVSPYYGHYKAETVLGKALRNIPRDKYFLSTKVGRYGKDGVNTWDYSAKRVTDSVYESMERLGIDFIDLINVHDIEFQAALPGGLQKVVDEGRAPFFVMLDHVTDVRNLGAIVRTAECAGVDAVVVPDRGSAQVNEDAIKSSSGALLRLPMCRETNLKTVVNLARQYDMQICAATEKGSVSYLTVDFRKPTLLIMGAEDTGISNELLKMSDVRASLPIVGEVQSLNVSVAAGVFMYEVLRQRTN